MTIRILPAVADPAAARALTALLDRVPDARPAPAVPDSEALLDTLAALATGGGAPGVPWTGGESAGPGGADAGLPEVVLVHERVGPVPALDLIRQVALRFPAVGVVLVTGDAGPALFSAAMDAGARGLVTLPLSYDDLAARVGSAAQWAAGVRAHLGGGQEAGAAGPAGTLVAVAGAKGGVGTTVTAVQLALAANAAGRRVALVDLDLQAGDVAAYLDVRFRRSVADLAGIQDLSPRVLRDVVHPHHTGLGVLLAPEDGERGEEVDDRTARQVLHALRSSYEVVVADCGSQMQAANSVAVELADIALLVTTPDVVCVRAAKRQVGLWERLQVRHAADTTTLVNRLIRNTEITPALVARTTGTSVPRTHVPAGFKELQPHVDSGRMQDLDPRSGIRQALWALAGELGLVHGAPAAARPGGTRGGHRGRATLTGRRRRALAAGAGDAGGPHQEG